MYRFNTIMGLLIAVLISIWLTGGAALAADGASIPVSCSIPAVPGLNAPAIHTAQNSGAADNQAITPVNEQNDQEQPLIIQEESQVELARNATDPSVITQTVYVR